MNSKIIKCPHCEYKYRTDIEKIVEDGETVAVRLGFSNVVRVSSRKTPKYVYVDLACPNCRKGFEWEIK